MKTGSVGLNDQRNPAGIWQWMDFDSFLLNSHATNSFCVVATKSAAIHTCKRVFGWLHAIGPPPAPHVAPQGLINRCAKLLPLPHNHSGTQTRSTLIGTHPSKALTVTHTQLRQIKHGCQKTTMSSSTADLTPSLRRLQFTFRAAFSRHRQVQTCFCFNSCTIQVTEGAAQLIYTLTSRWGGMLALCKNDPAARSYCQTITS